MSVKESKPRTVEIAGWVAVTDYGRGEIVLGEEGPFFPKIPCGWTDDTRWVRATATVTFNPSTKRINP